MEVRLPVSPHPALLMTWLDDADGAVPLRGARHHLKNLNAFTVAQAEKQWFHFPGVRTHDATGRLLPISPELVAGYGGEAARHSTRRAEISKSIQPRVGSGLEDNQIEMVTVSRGG